MTTQSNLCLDTDVLNKARALHRVWRALNDGACPKCHTQHAATAILRGHDAPALACPTCSFAITHEEITEIERMFAPAMDAAMALFESWRAERNGPTAQVDQLFNLKTADALDRLPARLKNSNGVHLVKLRADLHAVNFDEYLVLTEDDPLWQGKPEMIICRHPLSDMAFKDGFISPVFRIEIGPEDNREPIGTVRQKLLAAVTAYASLDKAWSSFNCWLFTRKN